MRNVCLAQVDLCGCHSDCLRTMSVKGWQCHEWKRCRCPDVGEVYLLQSEWFSCDGRSTRPGLACLMKDKLCRET